MKNLIVLSILLLLSSMHLNADSAEDRLPENTLFVITFPDLEKAGEALKNTSIGKLLRDPQLKNFSEELINPYEEKIQFFIEQYNQIIKKVKDINIGEITIAITDVNFAETIPVNVVISIEIRNGMDLAKQGLSMLNDVVEKDEKGYHFQELAHFKFIKNRLTLATSMDLLEMLESAEGANLKANQEYQNAKRKVQKKHIPGVFTFINTKLLYQAFLPMLPQDAQKIAQSLGIDKLESISAALNIASEHLHDAFFINYPGQTIIKNIATMEPISQEFLQNIPENATMFFGMNFNLKSFFNDLRTCLLTIYSSDRDVKSFNREIQGLSRELGMSFENDLGTLFGEVGFFQYRNKTTGLFPHVVFLSKCNDQITLGKLIATIEKQTRIIKIHKTLHQDHQLYYFSYHFDKRNWVRFEEMFAIGSPFVSMGFFLENGYVYFAEIHTLKDFIKHKASKNSNITKNKDFQNVFGKLSVKNPSLLLYRDMRSSFSTYWNTFLPILRNFEGLLRATGIPIETALLPDGKTFGSYFTPVGAGYKSTNEGIMFESYTHMGGIKLLGIPLIAFAIMENMPYYQRQQIKRNMNKFMQNIFQKLDSFFNKKSSSDAKIPSNTNNSMYESKR